MHHCLHLNWALHTQELKTKGGGPSLRNSIILFVSVVLLYYKLLWVPNREKSGV